MITRKLCALGLVASLALLGTMAEARTPTVGDAAPPFSATTFDGRKVSLDDLRGQVVIVNFWATWCGPCRQELPLLEGYARQQEQNGLHILAVTTDADDARGNIISQLQNILSFPLLQHPRGDFGLIDKAVPTNYVIDRNGVVRYAEAGAFNREVLDSVVIPLLHGGRQRDDSPRGGAIQTSFSGNSARP